MISDRLHTGNKTIMEIMLIKYADGRWKENGNFPFSDGGGKRLIYV